MSHRDRDAENQSQGESVSGRAIEIQTVAGNRLSSGGAPPDDPEALAPPGDMSGLVTFDCFDTVLTRAVGGPRSVAYVVAGRLQAQGLVPVATEVYVAARWRAEELVYRRAGDAGTLTDIAVQLADLLGLEPAVAADLERVELEVERELSRSVPAAVAQVARERSSGAPVGFLSDTPLSHETVEGWLRAQGAMQDGDLLWVSNELGASKDRGGAFFEVARRLGGVPGAWRHVGDNPRADGRMARLSGVTPTLVGRARLNRYENVLEDAAGATGGFSSLLAGASRRARLVLETERPAMPAARAAVATGVAAPLLVGYVLWCLRRAQRSGCRRVYFVARDGEVMLAIARRLVDGLGLDLDLRYLEGSRRAWLVPSLGDDAGDQLRAVLGREHKATVRTCLEWVHLAPESVPVQLAGAGYPEGTWDDRLSPEDVDRVVQLMVGPGLRALVDERAERLTEVTRDYLRQEGLLDGEPYALVDIGWQGTVGRLLTAVLERCGGQAPAVECYFGLTLPRHEARGRDLHGYMYDEWRGTGLGRRDNDIWLALEVFVAALHGSVTGYRRDGDRVEPVRRPLDAGSAAWTEDLRRGIDAFCTELAPTLGLLDPHVDVREPTWKALRKFWLHPTPAEVDAWGGYPFEDDVDTYPIASRLPLDEVLRSALSGTPRMRRRGTWPAGVWATTPPPVQVVHRAALAALGAGRKVARARQFAAGRSALRRRDEE